MELVPQPMLRGADAPVKVARQHDSVAKPDGGLADNITDRDAFIDQRGHRNPEKGMKATGLKSDREDVEATRQDKTRSPIALGTDDHDCRCCCWRTVVVGNAIMVLQVEFDELIWSRRQGRGDDICAELHLPLGKGTYYAPQTRSSLSLMDEHAPSSRNPATRQRLARFGGRMSANRQQRSWANGPLSKLPNIALGKLTLWINVPAGERTSMFGELDDLEIEARPAVLPRCLFR